MVQRFVSPDTMGPDDVAMLQRVFDSLCREGEHTRTERDRVALELLKLFRAGYTAESELLHMMGRRKAGP